MRRVKQLFVLLFLALWVPATGHCQWENVLTLETACGEHATTSEPSRDCCTSNCKALENGFIKSNPQTGADINVAILAAVFLLLEPPQTAVAPGEHITSAPPELSPRWQFVHRTALPVRAPSLLS